jgi:hypothetical protein
MNDPLDEKIRYNSLFDLYGALLTEKQREYFSYSYLEDYSLSEIADLLGVSRNAVHDQIKIVLGHLDEFEEKIGLLKRKKYLTALAAQLRKKYPDDATLATIADQIEKTE